MNLLEIIELVKSEYERAVMKFGSFKSAHEGYAILLEEVDELWDAIKLIKKPEDFQDQLAHEAVQVAAMAIRFLRDVCFKNPTILDYAKDQVKK